METMQANARSLAERIAGIGEFQLIGDEGAEQLPLVAFQLTEGHDYDEFDVASQLAAERGWMVPAYTLPPNADHVTIMRALVKLTLGHSLATTLADDIGEACADAGRQGRPARARPPAGEDGHGLLMKEGAEPGIDPAALNGWWRTPRWLRDLGPHGVAARRRDAAGGRRRLAAVAHRDDRRCR